MPRYFLEVAYKGTHYAGYQVQKNANTIQQEVEKALEVFFRNVFQLTGSSRTDAGVHAFQNFFHFDAYLPEEILNKGIYHLNAILPGDIVIKSIKKVGDEAHCRFDAVSREYEYSIYHLKNPFIQETACFTPHYINISLLNEAAALVLNYSNFKNFSKKNVQVFTYNCVITKSEWTEEKECIKYTVIGNRFLRGMVRGLVGTMMLVARKKYTLLDFKNILRGETNLMVDFSAPAHGLCLTKVIYP